MACVFALTACSFAAKAHTQNFARRFALLNYPAEYKIN
jgi:hypothetical protein